MNRTTENNNLRRYHSELRERRLTVWLSVVFLGLLAYLLSFFWR